MRWILKMLLWKELERHEIGHKNHPDHVCPFCHMTGEMIGEWFASNYKFK